MAVWGTPVATEGDAERAVRAALDLVAAADGLKAEVWWHRGRCLSYGEGAAFWARAQIVRQRLGIAEEDPPEGAAVKLAAGLDRFVPDPGEHAYAGLRLGRLLGVAFVGDPIAEDRGEALSREEPFAGWRLFFERLAAENPVILLVEDAQHADTGLLDFLDHLIDWVRDLPVYVLVFARPELQDHPPGPGHPAVRGGNSPLADRPGRGPARRGRVPADRRRRGTGRARQPAPTAGRPARRPGSRRTAAGRGRRRAGHHVPGRDADRGVRADEPPVQAALAALARREVLSVSADPLSPERGSHRFSQEMLRQVAYDTLSRRDRKARQLAPAAHLRAVFPGDGEQVTEVIARHYLDALNAIHDDPDAAEVRGQAVTAPPRERGAGHPPGDDVTGGRALLNLADALMPSDPADRG
jgi:hypothetical protein